MSDLKIKPNMSYFKCLGSFVLLFLFVSFFSVSSLFAASDQNEVSTQDGSKEIITVHLFEDRWCPVCQDAEKFIRSVIDDHPNFELEVYDITDKEKVEEIANNAGVEDYRIMAPMIFIENDLLQFNHFGERQEEILLNIFKGKSYDEEDDRYTFPVPLVNREISVKGWSLPALTVVLGSFDGFNVCSLGSLILILSLVMVFDSRKKILIYGGLFILSTVLVYGSLVFIWGKVFETLLGHLAIFRYIVGFAAAAGAIYFFKEFWRFYRYGPTCQSSDSALAKRAIMKIKENFKDPTSGALTLAGSVVMFAVVITVVELPCSIGVPVAFTGILVERGVSLTAYTGYILLYLLMYMLDEVVVFLGAVFTKRIWFANSKMVTWVTLFGALVLTYLSLYYLIGF